MFEIDARSKAIGIITGGRVKALEDAGLAIIDKTELSELQSLAQAKADGRLVVLPCKVGDTIWFLMPKAFDETRLTIAEIKIVDC